MKKPEAKAEKKPAPEAKKPTKARRRSGQGVLVLIASTLAVSGVIRLGNGASHAYDLVTNQVEEVQADVCTPDGEASALLKALQTREAELTAREDKIAESEQTIALAKTEIEAQMAELARAEEELSKTIMIADKAADEDVAKLVALYENMKPKEAAPLFQEMAPEFAAGFLTRMRPDAAASVLANLDPKTAYSISVLIAGRNANAPKN